MNEQAKRPNPLIRQNRYADTVAGDTKAGITWYLSEPDFFITTLCCLSQKTGHGKTDDFGVSGTRSNQ